MALPSTNITTGAVRTELGATSNAVSELVGNTGINKYSLYAPGTIGPDTNKNLVLTLPTSNYKLGDFRLYDHSSAAPTWYPPPSGFLYWGPGGSTTNANLYISMNWLNLACSSAHSSIIDTTTNPWHYHVRIDVYNSDAARTTGTSPVKNWVLGIDMNAVETGFTVLSGHSRDMAGKAIMNTGYSGNNFYLDSIAVDAGTCTRYFEAYFCDISGNRVMNFGTRGAGYPGYCNIEFRQNQQPQIYSGLSFAAMSQSNPPNIGGFSWTYAAPQINDNTTVCAVNSPLNMTQGSGNVSFYVKIKGICNGVNYTYGVTSADIILDYGPNGNDYSDQFFTGTSWSANSAGKQINTTLGGGRTWQYNWTGRVRLANTTFNAGDYQAC